MGFLLLLSDLVLLKLFVIDSSFPSFIYSVAYNSSTEAAFFILYVRKLVFVGTSHNFALKFDVLVPLSAHNVYD